MTAISSGISSATKPWPWVPRCRSGTRPRQSVHLVRQSVHSHPASAIRRGTSRSADRQGPRHHSVWCRDSRDRGLAKHRREKGEVLGASGAIPNGSHLAQSNRPDFRRHTVQSCRSVETYPAHGATLRPTESVAQPAEYPAWHVLSEMWVTLGRVLRAPKEHFVSRRNQESGSRACGAKCFSLERLEELLSGVVCSSPGGGRKHLQDRRRTQS